LTVQLKNSASQSAGLATFFISIAQRSGANHNALTMKMR
jgi:hypothetical protein